MRDYFKNWFGWPNWVCWVLPVEITMSFSAAYELIEWAVADVFFPAQGAAYLGSQGDIWDAQKDMGLAFSGAVLAMLMFSTAKRTDARFGHGILRARDALARDLTDLYQGHATGKAVMMSARVWLVQATA